MSFPVAEHGDFLHIGGQVTEVGVSADGLRYIMILTPVPDNTLYMGILSNTNEPVGVAVGDLVVCFLQKFPGTEESVAQAHVGIIFGMAIVHVNVSD